MDRLFLKIIKGSFSQNQSERAAVMGERISRVVESMLQTDPKLRPDVHWVRPLCPATDIDF